jgi:hypothetical protein
MFGVLQKNQRMGCNDRSVEMLESKPTVCWQGASETNNDDLSVVLPNLPYIHISQPTYIIHMPGTTTSRHFTFCVALGTIRINMQQTVVRTLVLQA